MVNFRTEEVGEKAPVTQLANQDTKVVSEGNGNQTATQQVVVQIVNPASLEKNQDVFTKTSPQKPKRSKTVKNVTQPNITHTENVNSNNNIGHANGPVIIGGANDNIGGDNSTNINGNDNQVNPSPKEEKPVEPTPPDPVPPIPEPPKYPISGEDDRDGKSWAEVLHHETNKPTGFPANNNKIVQAFQHINERNAYSFFKEYSLRAKKDNNVKTVDTMQDTYNILDLLNRISLRDTTPAMRALLDQAANAGLEGSPAYKELQNQIIYAECELDKYPFKPGGADANQMEASSFDRAIRNMIAAMGPVVEVQRR